MKFQNIKKGFHYLFVHLLLFGVNSSVSQSFSSGYQGSAIICSDSTISNWGVGPFGDGISTVFNSSNLLVHVPALNKAICVSKGYEFTMVIRADCTLWAWGKNAYGYLGDSSTISKLAPVKVHGVGNIGYFTNAKQVSANFGHTLALRNDSSVYAWGVGSSGQLGNTLKQDSHIPVKVQNITGITAVSSGHDFSLALKKDGTVWGWGTNQFGQLGNGNFGDPFCNCDSVPVQVHGFGNNGFLLNVTAIAAGDLHALALKSDSTVWAWGYDFYGELGNGSYVNSGCLCIWAPVQVTGLTGIVAIAAGETSAALKNDGTVWTWSNLLGNNTNATSNVPVQVHGPNNIGFLQNIVGISASMSHVLALRQDGTLWGWGLNSNGQLGNGTYNYSIRPDSVPIQVLEIPCNVTSSVSLFNESEETLTVFPNPSCNFVNVDIHSSYSLIKAIKIYNSAGEIVLESYFEDSQNEKINTSNLCPGIYSIIVSTDKKYYVSRFSKLAL